MTSAADVAGWVQRYRAAWNSNREDDIRALFTADAAYRTEPFRPAWQGIDHIVREWLARRDEPGETTFDWSLVAVADDLAVVQATTRYPGPTFSNLWLIRLVADVRCSDFTEWWMHHPGTDA